MSFGGLDADNIVTVAISVVTALATYGGVRITARSNAKGAEFSNWKNFTSEVREYFREQLEERDRRISALEEVEQDRDAYDYWLLTLSLPSPPWMPFQQWRRQNKEGD